MSASIASVAITLALVFYTIGVFAERHSGTLTASHLVFFYLGLVCDTAGTAVMSVIAQGESASPARSTAWKCCAARPPSWAARAIPPHK